MNEITKRHENQSKKWQILGKNYLTINIRQRDFPDEWLIKYICIVQRTLKKKYCMMCVVCVHDSL